VERVTCGAKEVRFLTTQRQALRWIGGKITFAVGEGDGIIADKVEEEGRGGRFRGKRFFLGERGERSVLRSPLKGAPLARAEKGGGGE